MADEKHELPPFKPKDEIEEAMFNALVEAGNVEQIKYDLIMKQAERAYNRYKKRQAQEKALNEAIENQNIVKRVCSELGITQRELAERLGVHLVSVQKWVANADNLPEQTLKTLDLLLENHKLKIKLDKVDTILRLINELQRSE